MKGGPKSPLRPFLHRALQLFMFSSQPGPAKRWEEGEGGMGGGMGRE